MQAFTSHTGKVLPFDRNNVDTDAILPKQYLKSISKFGYGDWLFDDFRYLDEGSVTTDIKTRRINPDFILNKPEYQGASILLARDNFGCGSSREHAAWAFRDYGIRALIAPSFADIFYNNCNKNGILPITLPEAIVDDLFERCKAADDLVLSIDLEKCEVHLGDEKIASFTMDEGRRQNLLQGKDDIALTLAHSDAIHNFEDLLEGREPWLFKKIEV